MASKTENPALYVNENLEFGVRREQGIPTPGDAEILIETCFSGANPADIKHATQLGIYPAVLGYDFCGEVKKSSAGSAFHPGQIVAGYTPPGIGRPAKYGAHQRFLVCPEKMAFSVPRNLPPQHAACLTVVSMTAADALYNIFKLSPPQETPDNKTSGPLLVWGGSSTVGLCAVQLARASGVYPIIVTASPERHSLLQELGATHCFDYKSSNVISDIKIAVQSAKYGPFRFGFDAVGTSSGIGSANLMARCMPDDAVLASVVVQSDTRFKMPFATTNAPVTIKTTNVAHPITVPPRPADHRRAWKVLHWIIENYNAHSGFRVPVVDVFRGTAEAAIEELKALGDNGRGFGKLVLKHPLL